MLMKRVVNMKKETEAGGRGHDENDRNMEIFGRMLTSIRHVSNVSRIEPAM
jgi:hypothetical protein